MSETMPDEHHQGATVGDSSLGADAVPEAVLNIPNLQVNISQNVFEEAGERSAARNSSGGDDGVDEKANIMPDTSKFDKQFWAHAPDWNHDKRDWKLAEQDNFELLLQRLLEQDNKKCTGWKEEVQNLLILAGLFSAVVTAFIIESYQTLQPNPSDQIISLLTRIADQMDTTVGKESTISSGFTPSPSSIRVNIFWFISLVLSLAVALIGIITLQWLREHQRYDTGMEAAHKFVIFNARSDGLKRWYIPQIFAGLPILLQASLVLIFAGLIDFLFAISGRVATPVTVSVSIPILFLVVTTILPTLQLCTVHLPYFLRVNDRIPALCPYKSPQALIYQRAITVSTALFNVFAHTFSTLCIPFVIVARLLSGSDKPFYGASAPFSIGNSNYQNFRDRLPNTASNWMSMEIHWLAVRTGYATAIHIPHSCRRLPWPYVSDLDLDGILTFYDYVGGVKNLARISDPRNGDYRIRLDDLISEISDRVTDSWIAPLEAATGLPDVGKALQAHLTAFIHIIGPFGHQQTANLVEMSRGDMDIIFIALIACIADQSLTHEFDFTHRDIGRRLQRHAKLVYLHLIHDAHKIFLCSNGLGIIPTLSLSTRRSFATHRVYLEGRNAPWMKFISGYWTPMLKKVIMDTLAVLPQQPFTHKCTGPTTARCDSNLHTESIVELTEYVLLFQVPEEIRATLRLLHDHFKSEPEPVQDRPFVLIIACAYINAVANVNQDDFDEFSTFLHEICVLCGSLDPTLEVRPGGTGRHWPKIEEAFDYIRSHCIPGVHGSVPAVSKSWDFPHCLGMYEKVRRQFIGGSKTTRTHEPV